MDCKHCMSRSTPDSPHASKKTVDAFIKFAKKIDTTKICISGGEPTSHPLFLSHFNHILKSFPGRSITLMSNGQFFKNRKLTSELATLQRQHPFFLQICSIKGLYPEYYTIYGLFKEFSYFFKDIYFIDSLNTIESRLGRANDNDITEFDPGKPRIASGCFNLYNISPNMGSLKETIQLLDAKTNFNFCKPMIDCFGNVHPGESVDCKVIGNIHKTSLIQLHRVLATTNPCGKCGSPTTLEAIMKHKDFNNCKILQIPRG